MIPVALLRGFERIELSDGGLYVPEAMADAMRDRHDERALTVAEAQVLVEKWRKESRR
jgi:hypothetical protein